MIRKHTPARSAAPLVAASLALLLAGCPADEKAAVEGERIEDIPADVTAVNPGEVEADADELRPAPTVDGATEELAIDVDEAAETPER